MWALQPTKLGSWQNYDVINALIKQGANPELKDKAGLNSFDYACSDYALYNELSKSFKFKPNKNKPNFKQELPEVNEEFDFGGLEASENLTHFDYEDDAELYI